MSNTLSVKITNSKKGGFEGTVNIVGLKPTKLARKIDGKTNFPSKASVNGAARSLAKSLGFNSVEVSYD